MIESIQRYTCDRCDATEEVAHRDRAALPNGWSSLRSSSSSSNAMADGLRQLCGACSHALERWLVGPAGAIAAGRVPRLNEAPTSPARDESGPMSPAKPAAHSTLAELAMTKWARLLEPTSSLSGRHVDGGVLVRVLRVYEQAKPAVICQVQADCDPKQMGLVVGAEPELLRVWLEPDASS